MFLKRIYPAILRPAELAVYKTATFLNKYTVLFTQDSFNFQRQNKSDLLNENEAMLFLVYMHISLSAIRQQMVAQWHAPTFIRLRNFLR